MKKQIQNWLSEDILKKLIKNSSMLLKGSMVAQIFNVITLILTARLLGAEMLGVLVLIQTYILIVDSLINFQSWQVLIKFGLESLSKDNDSEFKKHIKLSTIIDFTTAVLSTVIAIMCIYLFGNLIGIDDNYIYMVILYSSTILFNLSGTPIGVLRIFDKYKLFSFQLIINSVVKLIGVSIAYILQADLFFVVVVMIVTEIIGNTFLLFCGHYVLYVNKLHTWWTEKLTDIKSFLKFAIWTNLTTVADIPVKQLDMIIISLVVSVEGVGVYKVFKQISQILNKITDPIFQAIYPQLSELIALKKKHEAIKLVKKSGLLLGGLLSPIIIILSISSPYWLDLFFGTIFANYWMVLMLYLMLRLISVSFIGIHPLFIALGLVKLNFIFTLFTNFLYVIFAIILGMKFGLIGVVLAYGVQFSSGIILKSIFIKKDLVKSNKSIGETI